MPFAEEPWDPDLYQSVEYNVVHIDADAQNLLVNGGGIGLEKECLRVSRDGGIAQTPHPATLGSALTNPYITTDYSEALLELITPPFSAIETVSDFLRDAQKFVYENLRDEILWATSMPCVLAGGENVPIAYYGESNAGKMKSVYRRGLGHRYGRVMQVIAGVHFNFSVDEAFWPFFQTVRRDRQPLQGFANSAYLGVIRNLQRYGWLIPYLFGASPAVCKSFLSGKKTTLSEFDDSTYYAPYATSLRMGDIGYTNSKEMSVGIKANYNSLEAYVESLRHAIETSCPLWERIGVKADGVYRQLNSNLLQIENEYYSTVRPKQLLEGMEKPTLALLRRGVRYIELRSLDVNAYHPLGVSEEQLLFLRAFMLFCLFQESPPINIQERREIDQNLGGAAHRGRDPALYLLSQGRELRLRDWAYDLCRAMEPVCELLDGGNGDGPHGRALALQQEKIREPELTPSAQMLGEMRREGEGFFQFAQRMSHRHTRHFEAMTLSAERRRLFEREAEASLQRQLEIEAGDRIGFDQFLADYFAQA
jgi:glutamate--cysteine ligase